MSQEVFANAQLKGHGNWAADQRMIQLETITLTIMVRIQILCFIY